MFELLIRILCDIQPASSTSAIFLFGQTEDNDTSVLTKAQQLLQAKKTDRILFIDTPPFNGYPGYEAWKKKLLKAGVAEQQIVGVPMLPAPVLHTLVEAESLMTYARQQNFHSIYVTAAPFHQPRAFMTAVTAALRIYPEIRIYSQTGTPLPWLEEAVHSQGKTTGIRNQLIAGEMERIEKYQKQGDLASTEEVLGYLNRRDR
jgi:uncharacterized SAM-binding protein YcdF (DUF218 family)